MSPKFKKGDIICIADENDPRYAQKGFYEITDVREDGYALYSSQLDKTWFPEDLRTVISLGKESDYPERWDFDSAQVFIDSLYRVATDVEAILYAKRDPNGADPSKV